MNGVLAFKPSVKSTTTKVIDFSAVLRELNKNKQPEIKLNKDGSVDQRHCNKVAGVSSEVYAFTSEEEIKKMIDVFDKRIENASDENKRMIAARNKMMFLIGINIGVRASDLCGLKYNFFMNEDGTFKEHYSLKPKKTRKTNKFVKLYFNQTVVKAVTNYIEQYPLEDIDEYLFKSRKGDGHITEISLGRIIKDAAEEVGIDRNINSHSLRKTFGFWAWHNAEDKGKALITLQAIFNHSSQNITAKYIGLTNDEMCDVFNSLNLGFDFI